ncbi:hypothetical protein EC973_006012 [Apophysomyces ossiformis]|uniref:Uncharacterized protein n=1 Tax=Apophysomyces ossiformis TaxID=679940 RepID=A0A8H7BVW1_9FUNG|nr:hypothetical protein EC973_006012 [Apophysomyces ossiformis]
MAPLRWQEYQPTAFDRASQQQRIANSIWFASKFPRQKQQKPSTSKSVIVISSDEEDDMDDVRRERDVVMLDKNNDSQGTKPFNIGNHFQNPINLEEDTSQVKVTLSMDDEIMEVDILGLDTLLDSDDVIEIEHPQAQASIPNNNNAMDVISSPLLTASTLSDNEVMADVKHPELLPNGDIRGATEHEAIAESSGRISNSKGSLEKVEIKGKPEHLVVANGRTEGEELRSEIHTTTHTDEERKLSSEKMDTASVASATDSMDEKEMYDCQSVHEEYLSLSSSSNDTYMSAMSKSMTVKSHNENSEIKSTNESSTYNISTENRPVKTEFSPGPDWSYVKTLDRKEEEQWAACFDRKMPTKVKTNIPVERNLMEFLTTLEVYIRSVTGPLNTYENQDENSLTSQSSRHTLPRTTPKRLRSMHTQTQQDNPSPSILEPRRPYFPALAWQHSTWEDWAQFEVGDLIHYPFEPWEISIIDQQLERLQSRSKRRRSGIEDTLANIPNYNWEAIALELPGRVPNDCQRFWIDREKGYVLSHQRPVMISRRKRTRTDLSVHRLVSSMRLDGKRRVTSLKSALWGNLNREATFDEGSGDAIALGVVKNKENKLSVIAGSVCEDQLAYNRQGNLRLWQYESNRITQLRGHRISSRLPDGTQDLWCTVSDVQSSPDQSLFYSSGHDNLCRVWCSTTGRMLSTLSFHEKFVHKIAVKPDFSSHILASCSGDGTAVVWKLSPSGNGGSGNLCELEDKDGKCYKNVSFECGQFGHGLSENRLFVGISNADDHEQVGLIQAFDIETAMPVQQFTSMKGAVSDVVVSSSGRLLVSGNHSPLETGTGDKLLHINDTRQTSSVIMARTGHSDVNVVGISPCEKYVASGSDTNETAVFDIRRPKEALYRLLHKGEVVGLVSER